MSTATLALILSVLGGFSADMPLDTATPLAAAHARQCPPGCGAPPNCGCGMFGCRPPPCNPIPPPPPPPPLPPPSPSPTAPKFPRRFSAHVQWSCPGDVECGGLGKVRSVYQDLDNNRSLLLGLRSGEPWGTYPSPAALVCVCGGGVCACVRVQLARVTNFEQRFLNIYSCNNPLFADVYFFILTNIVTSRRAWVQLRQRVGHVAGIERVAGTFRLEIRNSKHDMLFQPGTGCSNAARLLPVCCSSVRRQRDG